MSKQIFQRRTVIPATMAQVIGFHNQPNAIRLLTPLPVMIQMHHDGRKSLTEGELDFTLWFAALPVHWVARHEPAPTETGFQDRMMSGPMAFWLHEHSFRAVPGGVELTDHLTYEHRASGFWSIFTRLMFDGLPLRMLFIYRHWRTRTLAPKVKP